MKTDRASSTVAAICVASVLAWLVSAWRSPGSPPPGWLTTQFQADASTVPAIGAWDPLSGAPIRSGEDHPSNTAGASGTERAAVYAGSNEPIAVVDGTVSHPGIASFDQALTSNPQATLTWLFRVQHTLSSTTVIPMRLRYRLSVSAGGDATIPGNAGANAVAKGILDLMLNVSNTPRLKYLICYAGTYHVAPDPSDNFCQDRTDDANWLPVSSSGVVSFDVQGTSPELALKGYAIVDAVALGYDWSTEGPKPEHDWGNTLTKACLYVDPTFPQADQVQVLSADGVGSSTFVPLTCTLVDYDGDGVKEDLDCNDNDPSIYPGAVEIYDGKDNNCNTRVDEDLTPPQITPPADVPAECSSHFGTSVNLGIPTVVDNMSMAPPPTVTNDARSLFPLGRTKVTWTATDVQGNVATAVQWVIVRDTRPPTITVVASPLRWGPGIRPSGSVTGQLRVSVVDVCDPSPVVTMTINGIPVTNGQRIRFEQALAPTTYWGHDRDGTLWIRARQFTLTNPGWARLMTLAM